MENESQPFDLDGAGFRALFDYDGDELPEEGHSEDPVLDESSPDAGSVHQEDESSSGSDGGGSGTGERESQEASGTEEAETSDGGGSGGGESAEGESSSEESAAGESSAEESSGGESSRGESSGGGSSREESSGHEAVPGTEESAFRESFEEYSEFGTAETLIPDGDLALLHNDLQFISCFLVLFLVIALCHYAYRFFKIFI